MSLITKKINKCENTFLTFTTLELVGNDVDERVLITITYVPSDQIIESYTIAVTSDINGKHEVKQSDELLKGIMSEIEQYLKPLYVAIAITMPDCSSVYINKAFSSDWEDVANYKFAESLK